MSVPAKSVRRPTRVEPSVLTRFHLPLQFDFHQKAWLLPALEINRVRETIFPEKLPALRSLAAHGLVSDFKSK